MERKNVKIEDTWDLSVIFSSIDEWEKEFAAVEREIPSLAKFEGKLGNSAQDLHDATACYLAISRKLEKVFSYARMLSDEDTADETNTELKERAFNLYARFGQLASFFSPELLAIPSKTIEQYLQEEILAPFRRTINETLRYAPHTLNAEQEQLLSLGAEVFSSTSNIFSQLNNADLTFEDISIGDKTYPLSHSSYAVYLKNQDRELREKAYNAYYREFDKHRNTLAATLSGSTKKNVFLSRARNYSSSLERGLFSDNIPTDVYSNLVSSVEKRLPVLHRYYELRSKRLKLDMPRLYDTYVPLVADKKIDISYEQACELLLESVKPLGQEYTSVLSQGLGEGRWVDKFENAGKRSGAYSSGCYDTPPFILMNYEKENLNSVFTLTHEAGHSMHSYFSRKHQSYQDHSYTIFVAEVASTVNEILLTDFMRKKYADDTTMQTYLVNHQIDDIKGTLFRQTMFAEFESIIHAQADANKPLGLGFFRASYRELLKKYFGSAVALEEIDELECFRIPHFYSAFYVFKYATGISAAITLAKGILEDRPGSLEKYLSFLSAGGSKDSIQLLREAGVDLETPLPVNSALDFFDERLSELETMF